MNREGFVFFDPKRRRWTWVRIVVAVAVVAVLASSVVFVKSLLIQPMLKMPESLTALRSINVITVVSGEISIWFSWSGYRNGADKPLGNGLFAGSETYKKACRYVVRRSR